MTFRLRHEFTDGAVVNGSKLGTCPHCATLRVVDLASGVAHFIRRAIEPQRVIDGPEPPCISATVPFRAPW